MRSPAVNASGETSLGVAAALLERAALLVTNDTGISHLAAALGTPSVVVFLASDPERWAPLDRERHRPVVARSLAADRPLVAMRRSIGDVPLAREVLDGALHVMTGAHDGETATGRRKMARRRRRRRRLCGHRRRTPGVPLRGRSASAGARRASLAPLPARRAGRLVQRRRHTRLPDARPERDRRRGSDRCAARDRFAGGMPGAGGV